MSCPLCNNEKFSESWLGATVFDEKIFDYVECQACQSLYCQPMPDDETLGKMYGLSYFGLDEDKPSGHDCDDPVDRFDKPLAWLKKQAPAMLLDYGCGNGELLEDAKKMGWQVAGLDFDAEVTEKVSRRIGAKVVTDARDLGEDFRADALHLGDVCEHLTKVNEQMPEILKLLKPGGFLLAQGPLEANGNLFTFVLKNSRKLKKNRTAEMPPYHVMLATAGGQRKFFNRFGLQEIIFEITEDAHPAPAKISAQDFSRPQKVGMFALRRLSQVFTSMNSKNWGNRYFYVGQTPESSR